MHNKCTTLLSIYETRVRVHTCVGEIGAEYMPLLGIHTAHVASALRCICSTNWKKIRRKNKTKKSDEKYEVQSTLEIHVHKIKSDVYIHETTHTYYILIYGK